MQRARTALGREAEKKLDDVDIGRYFDPYGVPCSTGRWAELFEARDNPALAKECGMPEGNDWWQLGLTELRQDVSVSTVWLGHNFGIGKRLIYETMVFGGELALECDRYSTREEAIAGHAAMVARVKLTLAPASWVHIDDVE